MNYYIKQPKNWKFKGRKNERKKPIDTCNYAYACVYSDNNNNIASYLKIICYAQFFLYQIIIIIMMLLLIKSDI